MIRLRRTRRAFVACALLLAACSSDKATGPDGLPPEGGPYEGAWAVSWGSITGDHATCRLPSMNVVLHQFGDSVVGTYTSHGDLACLRGGLLYVATPGSGQTGGHVSGDSVQFGYSIPLFTTHATVHDSTLSGTLQWLVAFTSIQTTYSVLSGAWTGRRLPSSAGAGTPADIELYPNLPALVGGDSGQIQDTVRDADGQVVPGAVVTFGTSDPGTATIGPNGVLQARGGALRLFSYSARTAGAYVDAVGVNIPGAARIVVSPAALAMSRYHIAQLSVQVLDSLGESIGYVTPTYAVQPTGVVTLNSTGEVTASGTLGSANVIIRAGGVQASVPVRVVSIPVSFTVTPDSGGLIAARDSLQMTAALVDSVGLPVPGSAVTYTSSNPTVLSVSSSGLIRSSGPDGFADITASSGTFSATRRFLVRSRPLPGVVATTQIGGSPFGAAIGRTGAFYVGEWGGGGLFRGDLPSYDLLGNLSSIESLTSITFDSSGRRAYVLQYHGHYVEVVDVDSNQVADSIDVGVVVGYSELLSLGLSPDGGKLFVGTEDRGTLVYDAHSFAMDTILAGNTVSAFSFNPSLPRVYITTSAGVEERDLSTLKVLRTWRLRGAAGTDVARDGSELFVAAADSGVRIVDLASGRIEPLVPVAPLFDLKVLSGPDVIIADGADGGVFVLDRGSHMILARLPVTGAPRRIGVDPAGDIAIEANQSGWVDFIK